MISQRIHQTISPPLVEIGQLASQTKGCISLGQGVPYYKPPKDFMTDFFQSAHDPEYYAYTSDFGIMELRKAISSKLQSENGIRGDENNVIISNGANQAFYNCIATLTDPGDEIILIGPYYFNHHMACTLNSVIPHEVASNSDFSLSSENIRKAINPLTKAIVISNPNNPTGYVYTFEDLQILLTICEESNITIISDETYEYFTYGSQKHLSIASMNKNYDKIITIGSFSKSYGIPGWRLGYYHGSFDFINESIKPQDTGPICAPALAQYLGLKLLGSRDSMLTKFVSLMANNHKIAFQELEDIDWLETIKTTGAYYFFPEQQTGINTSKLAKLLIVDQKVALVPGGAFGKFTKQNFRISFANVQEEKLIEAFNRLKKFKLPS